MTASLSETLGAFVAETGSLPAGIAHGGRRALLNGFGLAIDASTDPAVTGALAAMAAFDPRPTCTVMGRAERLDPPGAAFVNAIGMNLLDFDDTHLPTIIHPTAPVAPAVLALGEQRGTSGEEALLAFCLGAEIACRIGDAVSPGHYARGWHITSTCGTFGAAAASAKLMGLDAAGIANAIGVASSLAGGTVENLPTAGKNASVGAAARNGILAANLSAAGYEAAPRAVEGTLGWARACGDEPDVAKALHGLGSAWAFDLNAIKPYPAGIVFHSVIDACLALRERHAIAAEDIESVVVAGNSLLLERGDRVVANHRDARVSLHHAAATIFLHGTAGIADFEMPRVMAPEAKAFRARVRGELDPALPPGAARVEVMMRDGSVHRETVIHARGSIERPMTDADVEEKARRLIEGRGMRADTLVDLVRRFETLPSLAALMAASAPVRGG